METNNGEKKIWKRLLESILLKNWPVKIVALLVAMILWGMVLTSEDPERVKSLSGVQVMFDGEAELIARELVVRGDRDEILQDVRVNVNTKISTYNNLSSDDVNAVVNLKNITSKGTRRVPVSVSSQTGTVESVTPSSIEVEIDTLMEKTVPIELELIGGVPEGYWHGTPQFSEENAQIRGAEQDVARVAKAVCYVDRGTMTDSYKEAVDIIYLDENGEQISDNLFLSATSSITITIEVLAKKTVPINLDTVLIGTDELRANYEVKSVTCKPDVMEIVGDENILAGIDSLELQGLNIAGAADNITAEVSPILPEGVNVLGSDGVLLFVTIQEKKMMRTFEFPVEVRGLGEGLEAELAKETVSVSVFGKVSSISMLDTNDLVPYIDVSAKKAGIYEMEVSVAVTDVAMTAEIENISCVPERIRVELKK